MVKSFINYSKSCIGKFPISKEVVIRTSISSRKSNNIVCLNCYEAQSDKTYFFTMDFYLSTMEKSRTNIKIVFEFSSGKAERIFRYTELGVKLGEFSGRDFY